VPSHCYRMRVFDRDLIRGGHYGWRSCEPHLKAEHMAAPTHAANVKKALANSEPSTQGTKLPTWDVRATFASGGKADARGRGKIYSMAPSFVYSRVATIAA
jgi:hypothetical protein